MLKKLSINHITGAILQINNISSTPQKKPQTHTVSKYSQVLLISFRTAVYTPDSSSPQISFKTIVKAYQDRIIILI